MTPRGSVIRSRARRQRAPLADGKISLTRIYSYEPTISAKLHADKAGVIKQIKGVVRLWWLALI